MNFEVERTDGEVLFLPSVRTASLESYFVYDGEIDTLLPQAGIFPAGNPAGAPQEHRAVILSPPAPFRLKRMMEAYPKIDH